MARRQRDYKAEEQARNRRARAAGFSSRAQERRVRNESARWSRQHAEKPVAFYQPRWSVDKVKAYHEAFVKGPETFSSNTKARRGSDHQYHWLVTVTHYMTASEYEQRYNLHR
jgi:hypothetical protein